MSYQFHYKNRFIVYTIRNKVSENIIEVSIDRLKSNRKLASNAIETIDLSFHCFAFDKGLRSLKPVAKSAISNDTRWLANITSKVSKAILVN